MAVPPYKKLREIDGVLHKPCRWCDELLLKPDGSPDLRRNWHPKCADAYLLINDPNFLRRAVLRRDHGVCASCGQEARDWEADHIVPLIAGGSFDLENVQTLCHDCHAAKTAAENRARFSKPPAPPGPLLELMEAHV